MKRMWSVMLSVLLGALMVGLGTGYFLHLANKDRQALAQQADDAKTEMQRVKDQSEKAIAEANNKLHLASQEVDKAHQTLSALEQERLLLAEATPLLPPDPKLTKSWKTVISPALGISVQYPDTSDVIQNTELVLALGPSIADPSNQSQTASSSPWLIVAPYNKQSESLYLNLLSSTSSVSLFVSGKLIAGTFGKISTPYSEEDAAYVLRTYNNGTSTHLIWVQSPPTPKNISSRKSDSIDPKNIISTFDFKN